MVSIIFLNEWTATAVAKALTFYSVELLYKVLYESSQFVLEWGDSNAYILVLSSWKVNITETPIAVMGL